MTKTIIPKGPPVKTHNTHEVFLQKTKPKSEQASNSGFNYQIIGIKGTEENVKRHHEEAISKICGVENSIGQVTNVFNK